MSDPFDIFDRSSGLTMTLTKRTDGFYALADGTQKAPVTTVITITGHLIIGPYEQQARTSDHIMSGRAVQAGLVVERGEAVLWTNADVQVGDEIAIAMDSAPEPAKDWLVVEEMGRPGVGLIAKLTGYRQGRRQMRLKARAP